VSPLTLRLEPGGEPLPIANGQSLLEAAIAAGVPMRSSCRNGTCRECLCRLLEGRVHYRIDWPGISRDERRDGWVLPCVAVAETDVVVERRPG
jgi:ferredoxin